jgi:hypothetical protein
MAASRSAPSVKPGSLEAAHLAVNELLLEKQAPPVAATPV